MPKLLDYKDPKYASQPSDRIDPKLKKNKDWYIANLSSLLHYHLNNLNEIPYEFTGSSYSFDTLRAYARGKQGNISVKRKLLKEIGTSGTFKTKLKDVFQTYDILPEMFDVIRAINQKQDYDVVSVAIDDASIDDKELQKGLVKYMLQESARDLIKSTGYKPQAALSPEDLQFMTEADIDTLFDSGGYQLQREIVAVAACEYTRMVSGHKEIENLCNDDLITLGVAAVRNYIDYSTSEVKYTYVDPKYLMCPASKYNDFRDITRIGEMEPITIAQVKELNPNLTPEQLLEIVQLNSEDNSQYLAKMDGYTGVTSPYGGDPIDQCKVWVVRGQWLSANYETHLDTRSSIGGKIYKPVKYDYELNSQEKRKGAKLDRKRIISKYQATWIIGTDILLQYGEVKDKVYYGPNGDKTPRLDYFVVKTGNTSLIERCIPHVDDINLNNVKLRISVASLPPAPRMVIQQQMFNGVKLNGIKQTPEALMQTLLEKGYLVINGLDDHQRPIYQNGKAIDFLQTGLAEDVNIFSGLINESINRLRQVLGLPEGLDGTAGNPYQGLGKQELAASASSNALFPTLGRIAPLFSPLQDDNVKKWQQLAKDKKLRVKYKPLGEKNMKVLELSKDFSNAEFKNEMVMAPTDEKKQFLIQTMVEMAGDYKATAGAIGASRAEFLMVYKLIESGRIDMAMYRIAQIEKRREIAVQQKAAKDIQANAQVQQDSARVAGEESRNTAMFVEGEKRKTAVLSEAQKRKTGLANTFLKSFETEGASIPESVYMQLMAEADEEIGTSMASEEELAEGQMQGQEQMPQMV